MAGPMLRVYVQSSKITQEDASSPPVASGGPITPASARAVWATEGTEGTATETLPLVLVSVQSGPPRSTPAGTARERPSRAAANTAMCMDLHAIRLKLAVFGGKPFY